MKKSVRMSLLAIVPIVAFGATSSYAMTPNHTSLDGSNACRIDLDRQPHTPKEVRSCVQVLTSHGLVWRQIVTYDRS